MQYMMRHQDNGMRRSPCMIGIPCLVAQTLLTLLLKPTSGTGTSLQTEPVSARGNSC